MSNAHNLDLALKLRLRRILFSQGYWCPIEVELSHYDNLGTTVKRSSLTDLDVLGIRYDRLFASHKIVGDCKTGRNVSDANRLFWIRGVMDYFGADRAYFVRSRVDNHARGIAPKMGISILDDNDLLSLEKTLEVDKGLIPLAEPSTHQAIMALWGIDVPKGRKPSKEELSLKAVYSYLSYTYWYIDRHRNLLTLINHFQNIAHLCEAGNTRHVLLAYLGAERFAHCLLEIVSHVQSQGGEELPRYARNYIYGGPLALKEKEQFFDLLRKATGTAEMLDPPTWPQILELLNRLLRNPAGSSDILRHITAAYMWCAHMNNTSLPTLYATSPNTAAIVLAKDVCTTFTKVTGLSEGIFKAIEPL